MTSGRRHPVLAATLLATALVVAACEFSGEVPEPPDGNPITTAGPTADTSRPGDPDGTSGGAPTAPSASTFAASDELLGGFRRGPVPVPADLLAAATERCRLTPTPVYTSEIGSRRVVVADLRGAGVVLLVFADDQAAVGCRVTVAETGSLRATFFRVAASTASDLAADDLTLGAIEYLVDGGEPYVVAAGRVGDGAAQVRAGFDDDTYVTAAVDDGWWAMWWPGQARPASLTANDNRNIVIASVDVP